MYSLWTWVFDPPKSFSDFFYGSANRWECKYTVATPNPRSIVNIRHIAPQIYTLSPLSFLQRTIKLCIPTFFLISDNKKHPHFCLRINSLVVAALIARKTVDNYTHCLNSNKSIWYNEACFLAISCLNIDLNQPKIDFAQFSLKTKWEII